MEEDPEDCRPSPEQLQAHHDSLMSADMRAEDTAHYHPAPGLTWCGKDIEAMDRAELLAAFKHLWRIHVYQRDDTPERRAEMLNRSAPTPIQP